MALTGGRHGEITLQGCATAAAWGAAGGGLFHALGFGFKAKGVGNKADNGAARARDDFFAAYGEAERAAARNEFFAEAGNWVDPTKYVKQLSNEYKPFNGMISLFKDDDMAGMLINDEALKRGAEGLFTWRPLELDELGRPIWNKEINHNTMREAIQNQYDFIATAGIDATRPGILNVAGPDAAKYVFEPSVYFADEVLAALVAGYKPGRFTRDGIDFILLLSPRWFQ
jgi:hypothetical protein